MSKQCNCRSCVIWRQVNSTVEHGSREDLVKLVFEFHENWAMECMEHQYTQAILDGTWPTETTLHQLRKGLAKAEELEAERRAPFGKYLAHVTENLKSSVE